MKKWQVRRLCRYCTYYPSYGSLLVWRANGRPRSAVEEGDVVVFSPEPIWHVSALVGLSFISSLHGVIILQCLDYTSIIPFSTRRLIQRESPRARDFVCL